MGFKAEKKEVAQMMKDEFTSTLVAEMRANKGMLQRGDITVKLAENFGFCWGVERAVSTVLGTIVPKSLHIERLAFVPFAC